MIVELLIATTLLAAFVTFAVPNRYAPKLATGLSVVPLAISLFMYATFEGSGNALLSESIAFESQASWVDLGPYSLSWHVGLDGIALPLVVLSTVLTTLAMGSAWSPIDTRQSQFYGLVLVMEASLIGVFSALDFFAWFVFWEAVLVPMYFLIGVWGGPRRKYAAIKFFVYTNVASLAMFVSFVALVFGLPVDTFDLPAIAASLRAGELSGLAWIGADTLRIAAFVGIFAGFAVKVPIVPFHTWLPDAHVEAPTPVSVLLAGVLLKMGTYALLRFNFTMLDGVAREFAAIIALFAVVNVIYGALLALAQSDMKRIVAYSSVSSMGYVVLGLVAYTTYGVGGATFQMVAHGLISGLMFMTVGVIYNATHTRMVTQMSGIADRMPVASGALVAGAFGYMGLPLMSGFWGEFYVFVGAFDAFPGSAIFTAVAMFGIVIVAGYLLWMLQRTLFGPFELATDYEVGPAPVRDVAPVLALLGLVLLLGFVPNLIFDMITGAVDPILDPGVRVAVAGGESP
ncbi:oxidoreductase [Halobacteriales archaeon SW_7_68_16]|nr:MAG: oxidoreductase [Halobacteriales archaeon SW_7_68_16]